MTKSVQFSRFQHRKSTVLSYWLKIKKSKLTHVFVKLGVMKTLLQTEKQTNKHGNNNVAIHPSKVTCVLVLCFKAFLLLQFKKDKNIKLTKW